MWTDLFTRNAVFIQQILFLLSKFPTENLHRPNKMADILPIIFSMVRYILLYACWLTFEKQIDMYIFRTIDEYSFHLYTYQLHYMRTLRVYLRYIESVVQKYCHIYGILLNFEADSLYYL